MMNCVCLSSCGFLVRLRDGGNTRCNAAYIMRMNTATRSSTCNISPTASQLMTVLELHSACQRSQLLPDSFKCMLYLTTPWSALAIDGSVSQLLKSSAWNVSTMSKKLLPRVGWFTIVSQPVPQSWLENHRFLSITMLIYSRWFVLYTYYHIYSSC